MSPKTATDHPSTGSLTIAKSLSITSTTSADLDHSKHGMTFIPVASATATEDEEAMESMGATFGFTALPSPQQPQPETVTASKEQRKRRSPPEAIEEDNSSSKKPKKVVEEMILPITPPSLTPLVPESHPRIDALEKNQAIIFGLLKQLKESQPSEIAVDSIELGVYIKNCISEKMDDEELRKSMKLPATASTSKASKKSPSAATTPSPKTTVNVMDLVNELLISKILLSVASNLGMEDSEGKAQIKAIVNDFQLEVLPAFKKFFEKGVEIEGYDAHMKSLQDKKDAEEEARRQKKLQKKQKEAATVAENEKKKKK